MLDEATTSSNSPKPTDASSIMESTDNDEQVTLKKCVGKKRKRVENGYENSTCTLVKINSVFVLRKTDCNSNETPRNWRRASQVRKRKAQLILMSNGHYSKCRYQCATGVGAAFNLVNCFLLDLFPRLVFFYWLLIIKEAEFLKDISIKISNDNFETIKS